MFLVFFVGLSSMEMDEGLRSVDVTRFQRSASSTNDP